MDKFFKTLASILFSIEDWARRSPRTAIAVGLFLLGFILGLLF